MANPAIDATPLLRCARIFSVETRKRILAVAGKRMGVAAEAAVPEYPRPSGKPLPGIYTRTRKDGTSYQSKFKSAAMQGKVFSLIAEGKIPYTRSGLLGRSITSAISDLTGSSVTVKTGTTVRYAPLVIGDDGIQAPYHSGVWWQLHKVMEQNRNTIEGEGQKSLTDGVAKELKS